MLDVLGVPVPQGSIQAIPRKDGNGVATKYPPRVWRWRYQVQQAVAALNEKPFDDAVELTLVFDLPRPITHMGTGRNADRVKPSSPEYPIVAPDLDKLVRCVNDAITDAGLWHDDSQVVVIRTTKRYVTAQPGVHIVISDLAPIT